MIHPFENQFFVEINFLFFQDKNSRRKNHGILKKHIGFKMAVLDGVLNLSCNAKIIGEKFVYITKMLYLCSVIKTNQYEMV